MTLARPFGWLRRRSGKYGKPWILKGVSPPRIGKLSASIRQLRGVFWVICPGKRLSFSNATPAGISVVVGMWRRIPQRNCARVRDMSGAGVMLSAEPRAGDAAVAGNFPINPSLAEGRVTYKRCLSRSRMSPQMRGKQAIWPGILERVLGSDAAASGTSPPVQREDRCLAEDSTHSSAGGLGPASDRSA